MKSKIVVEIDCEDESCDKCRFVQRIEADGSQWKICSMFGWAKASGSRHYECLQAEKEAKI